MATQAQKTRSEQSTSDLPKSKIKRKQGDGLNLYRVATHCGKYGGYAIAIARDEQEAAELTNAILGENNADCRQDISVLRVKFLREARVSEVYAIQVWNGE